MSDSQVSHSVRAIAAVYGAALCAGLSVVMFPASANQLRLQHGFSDAAYGAIFLPQVACAVLGSLLGGWLSSRRGLALTLRAALAAFALGMLVLAATMGAPRFAYLLLLVAIALVGLGFGLSAAPLNAYPAELFPRRAASALVALHSVVGAGFALGPIAIAALSGRGLWQLAVLGVALCASASLALLPTSRKSRSPMEAAASPGAAAGLTPFVLIAVLYAFAEGTFANWAAVFLHEERGVAEGAAAVSLSVFWAALVGGRLLVSALVLRVRAERVWLALPPLIALSFLLLPSAHDAASGALRFALAGLSCGAFFPLTLGQAIAGERRSAAQVSSLLTAALMLGSGVGSFAIGALRDVLRIEHMYLLSSVYPLLAWLLALRLRTPTGARPRALRIESS